MASCKIISHSGKGRCLNIGDSGNIVSGTVVNGYSATGSMDQKWRIDNLNSRNEQFIMHLTQPTFGLNARTTNWNCTLFPTSGNLDGYIKLDPVSTGLYTIRLSKHDNKYLTAASNSDNTSISWTAKTGATNQTWKIQVLPEPPKVTGDYITAGPGNWLKLYKAPTDRNGRTVTMPSVSSFTSGGLSYSFTNKNYWYALENVTGVKWGVTGAPGTKNAGGQGPEVDEYGNYWMAVGPNVVNPNHSPSVKPGVSEMYGRGKLDVVVKNSTGTKFYIPGVIGDTKAHTWSNGIIQTFKSYPSGTLEPADGNFNGLVCAEFIGSSMSASTLSGLSAYTIDSIIFYPY